MNNIPSYITLMGAEQVQSAARQMQSAAEQMSRAASEMHEAADKKRRNDDDLLERQQAFMNDWLERFTQALSLNEADPPCNPNDGLPGGIVEF